MAAVEIARYDPVLAELVIDRLRAQGIPAFPLPNTGRGVWTGILVDESDQEAARRFILANQAAPR